MEPNDINLLTRGRNGIIEKEFASMVMRTKAGKGEINL